tara:strand:+ start:165 stop:1577 length:1413 start_codon:yes stop_codon:yes gene_type:complete
MIFNVPHENWEEFKKPILTKQYEKLFNGNFSIFSGYFEEKNIVYLFRDFLGVSTLFYRINNSEININFSYKNLICPDDIVNRNGAYNFIFFGTSRFSSLIDGIDICPPGSIISFDKKNKKLNLVYKHSIVPSKLERFNENEILNIYNKKLSESVKKNPYKGKKAIFMGGGIDAACIASKVEDKLDAITALPWGSISSERESSATNTKILKIQKHKFLEVGPQTFNSNNLENKYDIPLGSLNFLVINQMFNEDILDKYSTLLFGQGADTLFCSAGSQSTSALMPWILRRLFLKESDPVNLLLKMTSGGVMKDNSEIINNLIPKNLTKIQRIIMAGLKITHTPVDSEYFIIPAIKNNKYTFNPYYDLEVIKFLMGTKKKVAIDYSKRTRKFPFKFDKKLQRDLWRLISNSTLTPSKKNFYLSSNYEPIKEFLRITPSYIDGFKIKTENQRFAAYSLRKFADKNNLKISLDIS